MGRADPDAPPLTPCRAASRTRSLLRSAAYPDGAWIYWGLDRHTGRPWGEILDYHRKGGGPSRLPVRDVIGRPGPASTKGLLAWIGRRVPRSLVLDLRIEFGAEQQNETRQVKPGDEHDDSAE